VAAERLHEYRWLVIRGCWCQGFVIDEFCCTWSQILHAGGAYAEDKQQKGLGQLLGRMAHDGGFCRAVKTFHEVAVSGLKGGRPAEKEAT
jgi:hypothetical protein